MSITVEDISRYIARRIGHLHFTKEQYSAIGFREVTIAEMVAEITARKQELAQLQLYIGLKVDDENQRDDT